MNNIYIDMHCHPALKPYGQSYKFEPKGINSGSRNASNSIWKYNPPTKLDIAINKTAGLTKFSQANFTAMSYGDVGIICASLYPIERGFANNHAGTGKPSDLGFNLITGLGKERIDFIQAADNYFADLMMEYDFYLQLSNQVIHLPEGKVTYKVVKNFAEMESDMLLPMHDVKTIYVFFSIEGMHVINTGLPVQRPEAEILANVDAIKNLDFRPLFVSIAHHFYNDLCGHAKSLQGLTDFMTFQEPGLNTGFTDLGKKVLHRLLDNTNGRRIYQDIKHMSVTSRHELFDILQTDYRADYLAQKCPVLVSHGACNGRKNSTNPIMQLQDTARYLLDADINFYDDEIIAVIKSGGIFGFQLDERRIGNKEAINDMNLFMAKTKRLHKRSRLLWNQVQHIAELLDREGMFAWGNIAIGSDFDGIIDPLNGFWTAEEMDELVQYLERHAFNYMQNESHRMTQSFNKIDAGQIISRLFYSNAYEFIRKYYV